MENKPLCGKRSSQSDAGRSYKKPLKSKKSDFFLQQATGIRKQIVETETT